MYSKVSSDGLPSYIKATPPVLEIFKMDGYFRDNPRKVIPQPTVVCHETCHVLYLNITDMWNVSAAESTIKNLL